VVTLKDVAKKVGVSFKTVSRVANRDPAVNSETREQVAKALRELGYVPNEAARSMRAASSTVIGFMTDAVATTPYSVDIVRGVQAELRGSKRTLLIANTDGDAEVEAEFWRLFRAHRLAGVIYATHYHHEIPPPRPGFPVQVVLANCFTSSPGFLSVVPNDYEGCARQARHLVELGHRRIGLISLNPVIHAAALRGQAFRDVLSGAGIAIDETLILPGVIGPVGGETLVAFEAAVELLSRPDRPTAIVCGHDQIALQVAAAAASVGIKIPERLSIVGFDDLKLISEAMRPGLTTVALPYYEIGRVAARSLGDRRESHSPPKTRIAIDCPLVLRSSCGPLI
jgi:LacI family transcriptional regulator